MLQIATNQYLRNKMLTTRKSIWGSQFWREINKFSTLNLNTPQIGFPKCLKAIEP
jgi:hypothetical protein